MWVPWQQSGSKSSLQNIWKLGKFVCTAQFKHKATQFALQALENKIKTHLKVCLKYINNTLKTWNLLKSLCKKQFSLILSYKVEQNNFLAIYVLESKVHVEVNYTCIYIYMCICYTISLADHQVVFHHHSRCFPSSQITDTFRNPVLLALMQHAWHTENGNTQVQYHNMKTEHCLCLDCLPKFNFFLAYQQINPWNVIFTI